jgi:hypothetical protein
VPDAKLELFIEWINDYLKKYHSVYNTTPADVIQLSFTTSHDPGVMYIYASTNEPVDSISSLVTDFWYNYTSIRDITGLYNGTTTVHSYSEVVTYADAFSTTLVSNNPEIIPGHPSIPPSSPYENQYLPLLGGELFGPLYLYRDPIEVKEAVTKQYVDNSLAGVVNNLLQQINNISEQLVVTAYTHNQSTSSTIWTVTHNSSYMKFSYSLFDTEGFEVIPDEVEIVDENNIVIRLATPMAGHATFVFDMQ